MDSSIVQLISPLELYWGESARYCTGLERWGGGGSGGWLMVFSHSTPELWWRSVTTTGEFDWQNNLLLSEGSSEGFSGVWKSLGSRYDGNIHYPPNQRLILFGNLARLIVGKVSQKKINTIITIYVLYLIIKTKKYGKYNMQIWNLSISFFNTFSYSDRKEANLFRTWNS